MKKKLFIGLGLLCSLALASCNEDKPENGTTDPTNTSSAVQTEYVDPDTGETVGYFETPVVTTNEAATPAKPTEATGTETSQQTKNVTFERKHFNDTLLKNGPLTESCLPSIGSPRVLVIPVNLDNSKKNQKYLDDLEIAFNGSKAETGWYSVHEYYYESSYHKLDLQFDIMDEWFTPAHDANYYANYWDDELEEDGSCVLLREALAHYDSEIDYNDYNYDTGDDCIDAVWLIYNSDAIYEVDEDATDEELTLADFYWAYSSWYYGEEKYDGLYGYYYAFASVDFMYEEDTVYYNGNINVDAHTFIHETGHLLGVDDYYDYDKYEEEPIGPDGGLYSADMMDEDLGDHNAATKMLLGWIDPIIATGANASASYNLNVFTTTGDVIVVANHELTSIYDEYFIIEFYKNVGLNENDEPICNDYEYDIDAEGIRIIHVDAHKNIVGGEVIYNGLTGFKYDNSYADKKFIEHLRADYSSDMEEYVWPESLYTKGMTFGTDCWKNYKLNDGTELFFTVKVNSISNNSCNITISFK